jgi:hypothetical protein
MHEDIREATNRLTLICLSEWVKGAFGVEKLNSADADSEHQRRLPHGTQVFHWAGCTCEHPREEDREVALHACKSGETRTGKSSEGLDVEQLGILLECQSMWKSEKLEGKRKETSTQDPGIQTKPGAPSVFLRFERCFRRHVPSESKFRTKCPSAYALG